MGSHIVIFREGKTFRAYMIFNTGEYRCEADMKRAGSIFESESKQEIEERSKHFCEVHNIINGFRFIPS